MNQVESITNISLNSYKKRKGKGSNLWEHGVWEFSTLGKGIKMTQPKAKESEGKPCVGTL